VFHQNIPEGLLNKIGDYFKSLEDEAEVILTFAASEEKEPPPKRQSNIGVICSKHR